MKRFFHGAGLMLKHYRNTQAILRRVLREPLGLEQSLAIVRSRLERRKENFLEMMRHCVFEHPDSPYKKLLDRAGSSYQEICSLVERRGIEGTLSGLIDRGVYIDILEFKGKKPAVRGEERYRFQEKDFSNPLLSEGIRTRTGGTRGSGTNIVVPLEYIEAHNPYGVIAVSGYATLTHPAVIWLSILPSGDGLFFNLRFTALGNPPLKWFTPVDARHVRPALFDRLKTTSAVFLARRYGKRMPRPEFVDLRNTAAIARWMSGNLGSRPGYTVVCYTSSALRLVTEARKAGLPLGDTVFWVMGEPLTEDINAAIKAYGCRAYSLYGCNELMIIAHGCANPREPDDMHLSKDKLATVQFARRVEHSDLRVDSFLFTTLLKTSPKIFLNTETGDYGKIEKISCGCIYEQLGFDEHIHSVRSFEKLTAEGATFIGSDLIPLVQKILPERFGGSANDYQFVEDADEDGIPKLFMFISPHLGDMDERRIRGLVLESLTGGDYNHAYSTSLWDQAKTLQIVRSDPLPTRRGKIYPLHIRRPDDLDSRAPRSERMGGP